MNELVKRERQQEIADLSHALEALKASSALKARPGPNVAGAGNTFIGINADANADYANGTALGGGALPFASNSIRAWQHVNQRNLLKR